MKQLQTAILLTLLHCSSALLPWSYECDTSSRCSKVALQGNVGATQMSLGECLLICEEFSTLWPKPQSAQLARAVSRLNLNNVNYLTSLDQPSIMLGYTIEEQLDWARLKNINSVPETTTGVTFEIVFEDDYGSDYPRARRDTDESYSLSVVSTASLIQARVSAPTYFGARHALDTLFQLIEYDNLANSFVILSSVDISDSPEFSHRGISLDTSRNFINVNTLRDIIDAMSHAKLNVFHWHFSDSQSFPVEFATDPINQMVNYGAYGPDKVYTGDSIRNLVDYANLKGIRIIPELDQPSHAGSGWQFPGAQDFVVCFGQEPWQDYCGQPPCGQLNPAAQGVYDILEQIYSELFDMFDFDTFHMGADEVFFPCWDSVQAIKDYMAEQGWSADTEGFISLWKEFLGRSRDRLSNAASSIPDLKTIIWSSELTKDGYIDELSTEDYIVQIWGYGRDLGDPLISTLVSKGYPMIFSNSDALYLDCGFGSYNSYQSNWCSPYKLWQDLYENDLYELLQIRGFEITEETRDLVLGAESAMWTESASDGSIVSRLFPRSSALAERLWSNPERGSWRQAEQRLMQHVNRLQQRGIQTDAITSEYCRQNGYACVPQ